MDKIKSFMTDHKGILGDNRLQANDWDILEKAAHFLEPLASATLYAEKDKSSVAQSLELMDLLLAWYGEQKVSI